MIQLSYFWENRMFNKFCINQKVAFRIATLVALTSLALGANIANAADTSTTLPVTAASDIPKVGDTQGTVLAKGTCALDNSIRDQFSKLTINVQLVNKDTNAVLGNTS